MTPQETVALVLAGGLSRRFAGPDKLLATLGGLPLAAHIAGALGDVGFADRLAVVPQGFDARASIFADAGFRVIANPEPARGQGASLALGARAVADTPAAGMMVLLADMPFVRRPHLRRLLRRIGSAAVAVSVADGIRTPPVLFARQAFPMLGVLEGDTGARQVLDRLAPVVEVSMLPGSAVDIDTEADLAQAEPACR